VIVIIKGRQIHNYSRLMFEELNGY